MPEIEDIIFRRMEDHEMRIRVLEKAHWRSLGATGLAAAIGTLVAGAALRFIVGWVG